MQVQYRNVELNNTGTARKLACSDLRYHYNTIKLIMQINQFNKLYKSTSRSRPSWNRNTTPMQMTDICTYTHQNKTARLLQSA